jgi:hypothetical protein
MSKLYHINNSAPRGFAVQPRKNHPATAQYFNGRGLRCIGQVPLSSKKYKIIENTEKENEMGPNTLSIMMGAGGLVAALVAYLLYSSFKRA